MCKGRHTGPKGIWYPSPCNPLWHHVSLCTSSGAIVSIILVSIKFSLTPAAAVKSRTIPAVDKGVATVVLDKQDYTNKAQDFISPMNTYKPISVDSTTKHKNKVFHMPRTIKVLGGLGDSTYKRLYSTGACSPNFRFSKIHKQGTPSGLKYPAGEQSLTVWPRSWLTSSGH